ncbi:MAG: hypothetical protein U1E34_04360 [Amaricoccus sp.]
MTGLPIVSVTVIVDVEVLVMGIGKAPTGCAREYFRAIGPI